eukprot:TRINITY_DN37972_c0_g1_i2.p1 TRINITY_DN37972_c0_g1~~TRINITY_DN37972_c0_g1_i2.p1  ORF type:complete len:662 (-),score=152.75 TRINITY_DN37972_c0_g1_i2:55-2040(-)
MHLGMPLGMLPAFGLEVMSPRLMHPGIRRSSVQKYLRAEQAKYNTRIWKERAGLDYLQYADAKVAKQSKLNLAPAEKPPPEPEEDPKALKKAREARIAVLFSQLAGAEVSNLPPSGFADHVANLLKEPEDQEPEAIVTWAQAKAELAAIVDALIQMGDDAPLGQLDRAQEAIELYSFLEEQRQEDPGIQALSMSLIYTLGGVEHARLFLDEHASRSLSYLEFAMGINFLGLNLKTLCDMTEREAFEKIDMDGGGVIDFQEVIELSNPKKKKKASLAAAGVLKAADKFKRLGSGKLPPMENKPPSPDVGSRATPGSPPLSPQTPQQRVGTAKTLATKGLKTIGDRDDEGVRFRAMAPVKSSKESGWSSWSLFEERGCTPIAGHSSFDPKEIDREINRLALEEEDWRKGAPSRTHKKWTQVALWLAAFTREAHLLVKSQAPQDEDPVFQKLMSQACPVEVATNHEVSDLAADDEVPELATDGDVPEVAADGEVPSVVVDEEIPKGVTDGVVPEAAADSEVPEVAADKEVPEAAADNGELLYEMTATRFEEELQLLFSGAADMEIGTGIPLMTKDALLLFFEDLKESDLNRYRKLGRDMVTVNSAYNDAMTLQAKHLRIDEGLAFWSFKLVLHKLFQDIGDRWMGLLRQRGTLMDTIIRSRQRI